MSELKTRPEGLSLYLCLPQRYMNTHYRWLRMMISLTVTEMEKVRGRPATGHPILMVLDEFAGLKRMEVIETAAAQIAGYGVKMFFVLQSLEQLKAVYKDNWETFLANSGLKVFFNLEDNFSRDYVSKLIGETEVIREVRSESDSTSRIGKHVAQRRRRRTRRTTGTSSSSGTSERRDQQLGRGRQGARRTAHEAVMDARTVLFGAGFIKANLQRNDSRSWSDCRQHGRLEGLERRAVGRGFARHVALADRRHVERDDRHERDGRDNARHVAVAHGGDERDHPEARPRHAR